MFPDMTVAVLSLGLDSDTDLAAWSDAAFFASWGFEFNRSRTGTHRGGYIHGRDIQGWKRK